MKRLKRILGFLVAAVFLLFLGGIALVAFLDLNAYKPRIEAAASGALGKDVRIKGEIKLALLPSVGTEIRDVCVKSGPGFSHEDMVSLEKIKIALEVLPILKRQVQVKRIELVKPVIRIERDAKGRFNFAGQAEKGPPADKKGAGKDARPALRMVQVQRLFLSGGDFTYVDMKSGKTTRVRDLDLEIKDLALVRACPEGREEAGILKGLSFEGTLDAAAIESGKMALSHLDSRISVNQGMITLDRLRFNILGSAAKGRVSMDLAGKRPVIDLRQEIPHLDLKKATAAATEKKTMEGSLAVSVRLGAQGFKGDDFLKTLCGKLSLKGRDLTLHRYDIDTILTQYEKTQNVDLVDLGAIFLAGPLGILLTKSLDGALAYRGLGSAQTRITRLVSEWQISEGVARAEDVAAATAKNRIAAKGNLDLTRGRFDNLVVAVLDKRGCAKFLIMIKGTFQDPEFEKAEFAAKSLTGMFTSLFKKARAVLCQEEPKVFYKGSIPHPAGK